MFERLLSPSLLTDAFARVRANAGAAGYDGQSVGEFDHGLEANIAALAAELASGAYEPRALLQVPIAKPGGGTRKLCIPAVRDRILQTAAALILAPVLEANEFEPVSFAYRPGRGVQMALAEVLRHRDDGYEWLLDADIDDFFDRIDHPLLLAKLARHVADERVLQLVLDWIEGEVRGPGGSWTMLRGIPQGSPLSPLLANLYLDELDEAVQVRYPMVRYADDFVVLARSRDEAESARDLIIEVLDRLKLSLNDEKTRIVSFDEGFVFLGARFLSGAMVLEWREGRSASTSPISSEAQCEPTKAGQPADGGAVARRPRRSLNSALADALHEALAESASVRSNDDRRGADIEPGAAELRDGPQPYAGHQPRLRTLHITEGGCYLAHAGDRILVKKRDEVLRDLPAAYVDLVVVSAHGLLSTPFMRFCCERGIDLALTDAFGRWYGLLSREPVDRIATQRAQFRREQDPAFVLGSARVMVLGKLVNSRTLMRRYARRRQSDFLAAAIAGLDHAIDGARQAVDLEVLRGCEGAGAAAYFDGLRGLLSEAGWAFGPRSRPAMDAFNAALNYGYSILLANVSCLMRQAGLSPYVGFLHACRQGHPAGASDLVEEFRAVAVDAVMLNAFLRQRLRETDFEPTAEGMRISVSARRLLIHALEGRLNAPIEGRESEATDLRRQIERQTRLFAKVLRGETTAYRAFTIR